MSEPSPASRPGLGPDGLLLSSQWLDQADAVEQVAARQKAGTITAEEAENLLQLRRDGYCVFRPQWPAGVFQALDDDVERIWREQPPSVAWAYNSRLTRFSGQDGEKRRPSCRLADVHSVSAPAKWLFLNTAIHRYATLVLGSPALATQSLYFQWGSQQTLHRDPIHVQMTPAADLLAAWIALEDIAPDSGPLMYVPGSHRLPYYQFAPGRYIHDHEADGLAGIAAAEAWDRQHCAAAALAAQPFLPKQGEVLLWHHSLLHGGSVPTNPERTRKSFVVHFTRDGNMPQLTNRYDDPFGPPVPMAYSTARRARLGDAVGFESPLLDVVMQETARIYGAGGATVVDRLAGRERQIELMENSRFWKLRNAWFKVRAGIGLS
jgi:phytanoyl-CoA hydroxylase